MAAAWRAMLGSRRGPRWGRESQGPMSPGRLAAIWARGPEDMIADLVNDVV